MVETQEFCTKCILNMFKGKTVVVNKKTNNKTESLQ